ncbi:MAG: toll/interleukin-1 receptor domain-containing protein [Verrucomicrobiota bacterium]
MQQEGSKESRSSSLKVFLSYRRDDFGGHGPGMVCRIFDRVAERYGEENVFMDIDTIPSGVDVAEFLGNAVENTDVLLAIVGPSWTKILRQRRKQRDDFVRIEIQSALERGIPVVPVLIDGARMPKARQLPKEIRGLERRNAAIIHSGRDFNGHMTRLLDELEQSLHLEPLVETSEELLEQGPGEGRLEKSNEDGEGESVEELVAAPHLVPSLAEEETSSSDVFILQETLPKDALRQDIGGRRQEKEGPPFAEPDSAMRKRQRAWILGGVAVMGIILLMALVPRWTGPGESDGATEGESPAEGREQNVEALPDDGETRASGETDGPPDEVTGR